MTANAKHRPDTEARVSRDLPGKIRRTLGRIPFTEPALAAWYCARDPATPKHVKIAILGALAYFITPVDAIPDILLVLGYTDDAAVFWAVWRTVAKYITDDHLGQARDFLDRS